ncbi:putative Cullin family protein [Phytophthora cinnamomi]|uniref:putative Cullin family protein n=1 Tax=Phytophthora cinnamomi TaxID=4785 RepID=UPI00355984D2|nr:putative Cullin family protein [Phytophthora cinnamomi]
MKKLVIKPYRQNMGMDQARAAEIWASLRTAIHEIFSHNASLLSFEELYRNSYNLVLHKHGDLLYGGVVGVITEHLQAVARQVAAASDDLLLVALHDQWADHQVVMTMVRDILMYMDRTYVTQKRKLPVYDSGLYIFRDAIVRHDSVRERLRARLLRCIERERHGELIDRGLVKSVLRMLVDLGVHSNAVYEADFERFFLDTTLDFYRAEAQAMLDVATCPEYLEKAEQRLNEEGARVLHYLNPSTEHKLKAIVETQLIKNQAKALVDMEHSGCVALFRDGKAQALRRMYSLFRRVPSTLPEISDCVLQYIKTNGDEIVKTQSNPETALDASQFVEKLLALREKFVGFLSDCFFDDPQFHKSIKQGFEAFMNTNTVCAGYLAHYLDELLRSKNKFEEEMDTRVTQVIALFRYLQDKDVFEEFYKVLLAKRLLNSRGTSDEAEKLVISKLKAECGYQFTSKLEGMFKDMSISKDLMELYRKSSYDTRGSSFNIDPSVAPMPLSVHVLTSGFWPTEMAPMCALPVELVQLTQTFESFYCARHNGRKLAWMANMGTVDVRATFSAGVEDTKRRHELNVSTYQAVILMLFNQRSEWRFKELVERTRIDVKDLKRHLISLCTPKYKILIKSSKGKRIDEEADTFSINDAYKSKLHRVRIPLVSQKETSLLPAVASSTSNPADALPPTVAEDRKHLVEAAIVRIMKTRKQMQHNQLIAEVTRQMAGRFTPSPQLIKLRIESLIEREYLQRSTTDRRMYNYLA